MINSGKKLVWCYVWDIVIFSSESWTLRKLETEVFRELVCGAGGEWRRLNVSGKIILKNSTHRREEDTCK